MTIEERLDRIEKHLKMEDDKPSEILETFIDERTDLEWQLNPPDNVMTWEMANKYVHRLGDGWRLPTINELIDMYDYENSKPFHEDLKWESSYYWSSTTYAPSTSSAWLVYFGNGYVLSSDKTNTGYVRCVREKEKE